MNSIFHYIFQNGIMSPIDTIIEKGEEAIQKEMVIQSHRLVLKYGWWIEQFSHTGEKLKWTKKTLCI